MAGRRWTFEHVVALVYVLCGVFLAVYLPLGIGLVGVVGFVFAAVVLVGFLVMAWREWRRARVAAAEPPLPGSWRDLVRRPRSSGPRPGPGPVLVAPPAPPPAPPRGPPPLLSDEGRAELARVVAVLADAGLWAPRVPEPAVLEEAVADRGEPVDVAGVLSAPWEAPYYHPGARAADHLGALVEDSWKGEQLPETLHATVADLADLVADVLEVRLEALELQAEGRYLRHRLTLVLGGERVVLDYLGDHKWLSTVPHVAVARAVHATGAPVRLATCGDDQTLWIVALRDGVTVEGLNADLGPAAPDPWEWLDEQEPFAAGTFRLGYFGE